MQPKKSSKISFLTPAIYANMLRLEIGASFHCEVWSILGLKPSEMVIRWIWLEPIEMPVSLRKHRDELAEFCKRNQIRRLALFGSSIRDDFTPESDVDVLVEFEPGARVGLIRLAGLELELGEILGRKVDLNTPGFLSKYYREQVLSEAEIQYDASRWRCPFTAYARPRAGGAQHGAGKEKSRPAKK